MENQYRVGLLRMERAIRERMGAVDLDSVMPHDLINAKPAAAAVRSAMTPVDGGVTTALGLPMADGLQVQLFDNASSAYVTHTFTDGAWQPTEPVIALGQALTGIVLYQRTMVVGRRHPGERVVNQPLPGGALEQIFAANDLGDAHVVIVGHHG